ncbi:type II toxin-antitoxin system RelE/ParE family toxin [Mesorhizobium sp. LHD-90]|uniref:type II toxin-antitoxin system RelE/ParE family toxin n=1 Tax=Mesorhizobium sp. LHD-90 TaxID=3071414 RepID=UPI0027DEBEA4|nr:type II toxin-antitoxin system RelE/ParE family toxin [Mesorhizobium sp. LHD-90]MDQ6434738.1 type II toxin-antitoxin system RelE/ParE family toxin [Mesorhizobium sp. LHD-90]
MSFRLHPEAKADIKAITHYIAKDNRRAAEGWFEEVYERCRRIGEMPRMGVARFDIRPGLRSLPFGNYLILYGEIEGGVEIIRVVHGARQWEDLL